MMRSIVSWSRIFVDQEVLVAFSTDRQQTLAAYSTVASRFRKEGNQLNLIFGTPVEMQRHRLLT